MNGRFTYNSINVDFERSWNNFQIEKINKQSVSESMAGLQETLEFYNRDLIHLERNYLTGTEIEKLRRWWNYVRDGSSFTLYRDRNFGFEIDFAGKSLNESNGNSPTFARTGVANIVDPDTGFVTSIAANTGRFETGQFGRALLIENATTNLLTNTEGFGAGWSFTNIVPSATTIEDPEGDSSSKTIKLTAVTDNGTGLQSTTTAINNTSATFSVWMRTITNTRTVTLYLYDTTAAQLASQACTVTTEWQRFSVSYTDTSSNANNWRVVFKMASSTDVIYMWGTQLEIKPYMTSYITGESTRNAENIYYDLSSVNFNAKQFSISMWVKHPWAYNTGTSRFLFEISDGSSIQTAYLYMNTSNQLFFDINNIEGNAIGGGLNFVTGSFLTANTWHHLVVVVDTTGTDSIYVYHNGILKTTPYSYPGIPVVTNRLYLGMTYSSNDYHGNCLFDDVVLYKSALTASEIKAIYNKNHSLGFEKNYWSAVKIANPSFNPLRQVGGKWNFNTDLIEVLS